MESSRVKTRPVGAKASLAKGGHPDIVSDTGGALGVATRVSEAGFSPLDLLFASLASCLAISARIAASRLGVLDRLEHVSVHVTGDKATDEPTRIERFRIAFEIEGDLDAAARQSIVEAAEGEICTVSNTLRGAPAFETTLAPGPRLSRPSSGSGN